MDVEDFKKKYEQLKDNPMYKNFCSILDTKSQVLERTAKENQELKKQLKIKHDGFMASVDESCELAEENQKYKEVIDKISKIIYEIKELTEETGGYPSNYIDNLLDILKEVEI